MLKTQELDNFRNIVKELLYLLPALLLPPFPPLVLHMGIWTTNNFALPLSVLVGSSVVWAFSVVCFFFPVLRKERTTTESLITYIRKEIL